VFFHYNYKRNQVEFAEEKAEIKYIREQDKDIEIERNLRLANIQAVKDKFEIEHGVKIKTDVSLGR
jgi:hypothetical protein